jgi:prophage antirepressor-like protein
MNDLTTFAYGAKPVRVIDRDGQPWWVLKDVCDVLEINNSRMVADRLDDDEKGVSQTYTPGGSQEATIISESGLYSVILRSDKPEARKFRKWVTSEVLPSIRKTGGYIRDDAVDRLTDRVCETLSRRLPGSDALIAAAMPDPLAGLSDAEREEIEVWKRLLIDWREFRMYMRNKEDADNAFVAKYNDEHPGAVISRRVLYRQWRYWREGKEHLLPDRRGLHGNQLKGKEWNDKFSGRENNRKKETTA